MPRFRDVLAEADGWTRWVRPVMRGYGMQCCDCDLVHRLEFRVIRTAPEDAPEEVELDPAQYRVEFRAKRMPRRKKVMP